MGLWDTVTKAASDFVTKRVPKDVEFGKAEIAWMAAGGVTGLVVDIAALPLGVVTGGVASGAGVAAGYSAKVAVDKLADKVGHFKARARAEKARKLFEKYKFQTGVDVMTAQLDIHTAKIKKNRNKELDLAVATQTKAFEAFVKKPTAATPAAG
ncbi:putative membrane protein [Mycolicibacterium sp. BK556]|uniref:hypothetical protein n=1 Tax=unclassified Mycolicibacterium TaxID=2636767 RepID=UPI001606FB08|nr:MULTISPECIES: hypothetical protein [unclassified Mycolicibacterium]MBB3606374.1 putative membrane protein [Mycolicibacterium sp. BK556]MBB3636380.1 putative membrane protein [Mycolicibacterium sp. BK607]